MKIQKIQAFPLAYPEPHYKGIERYITLARVESDDGLVGWGECISQFREATLATQIIIDQGFAPMLTGEDALDVERHWHKMLDHIWWYGTEGIAALNTAASLHMLASSPHADCTDFKPHESPMQHELVSDPWVQENGYVAIRDVPGLGVTVCEDVVEKYVFG